MADFRTATSFIGGTPRWICAAAILGTALLPARAQTPNVGTLDDARSKLDRPIEFLVKQNYRQFSPKTIDKIPAGQRKSFSVKLVSGVLNAIIASCGEDCSEVEIALYDYRHSLVARSNNTDDVAVKIGKPPYDGLYEVEIAVPGCRAAQCEVGLLVLRQEPASNVAPSANYKTYENRDLNGGDLGTAIKNVDQPACASACTANAQCRAYSFDKWNRHCYLKSGINALRLDPRSVTVIRDDLPTPPMAISIEIMERYRGKGFPGTGYKAVRVADFTSCETTCSGERACVAYTFHKNDQRCHLFDNTGEYFGDRNADSGGKIQEPPKTSTAEAVPEPLREIRTRLYELNFDPGPIDGKQNDLTKQAIREFEAANKMAQTGEPTQDLLRRLRETNALKPWGTIVYAKSTHKWGIASNQATRKESVASALSSCGDEPELCTVEVSIFGTQCAALARSGSSYAIVARDNVKWAKEAAIGDCEKQGHGCRTIASVCADGTGKFDVAR